MSGIATVACCLVQGLIEGVGGLVAAGEYASSVAGEELWAGVRSEGDGHCEAVCSCGECSQS